MFFKVLNIYQRPIKCITNNFKINLRYLSQASNHELNNKKTVSSSIFADYKLIYASRDIAIPSLHNMGKRNATIFAGISVPLLLGLHAADIASEVFVIKAACSVFVITALLHIFGVLKYNYIVGAIYTKQRERKVILSYVDYWGKRKDLHIHETEIIPPDNETRVSINTSYDIIKVSSQKQLFRIAINHEYIYDDEQFTQIFGPRT